MRSECVYDLFEFSAKLRFFSLFLVIATYFPINPLNFFMQRFVFSLQGWNILIGLQWFVVFGFWYFIFRSDTASEILKPQDLCLFRHKYLFEQNSCLVWARKGHFVGWGEAETNWLCQPHQMRPRRQLWTLLKQKTPVPLAPLSLSLYCRHNFSPFAEITVQKKH